VGEASTRRPILSNRSSMVAAVRAAGAEVGSLADDARRAGQGLVVVVKAGFLLMNRGVEDAKAMGLR
jgi:hypothetical protein